MMMAGIMFPRLLVNLVVQTCVFFWRDCTCGSFVGGGKDVGALGDASCCYN